MTESPQHECGVVAIFSPGKDISNDLYYSLIALQNRGQEGAGIALFDSARGGQRLHKDVGLVNAVLTPKIIEEMTGDIGTGHVRYGTTGKTSPENTQPFMLLSDLGPFALSKNGNIFNASELRCEVESQGVVLASTSDSEVFGQAVALSPGATYVDKIRNAAKRVKGAYSFAIATPDKIFAARDPHGIWPLSLGKINGSGYIVASESNGIERIGGKVLREVENGEILTISKDGIESDFMDQKREALCSFEYFYFSDPYSKHLGRRVENARFEMGKSLAEEHFFKADWIIPVPETARPAAEGYALASGIPVRGALTRNRWLGRTFIEPSQRMRELAAELKYGPLGEVIKGSVINVVDDSIVRGTTTRHLVKILREVGAKRVNVLITAPPIIDICHFGVDTANRDELIAAKQSTSEIEKFIEADNLGYLSLESGMQAIGKHLENRLCTGCFTGRHPMQVPQNRDKFILEMVKS